MVAPFAGAWIEIPVFRRLVFCWIVAPFAGAWIEILFGSQYLNFTFCRSLRGSVD